MRQPRSTQTRAITISQIVGGVLLGVGVFWFIKMLFFSSASTPQVVPLLHAAVTPTAVVGTVSTPAPLHAAGITLSTANASGLMSQIQASQLAGQLFPDAPGAAKKTLVECVTLNYPESLVIKGHADLHNVPVWMVWYQSVRQPAYANGIATTTMPNHDLYVFLDGKTGKEVLTIWN